MWTRRQFSLRSLAVAASVALWPKALLANASSSLFVERILQRFPAATREHRLGYRADVTIQILRVPLFRKRGVGGAVAAIREYTNRDEQALGISFLAGSNPSEAGGVNRFGYIEEVVVERGAVPLEAAYFGVMTSSPEDNFDSARSALGEAGKEATTYAGIDGYLKASRSISTEASFLASGKYTWAQHPPLGDLMKGALRDTNSKVKEKAQANPSWEIPITFLYAIARAMRQTEGKQTTNYIYHGQEFRLETHAEADASATDDFRKRTIIGQTGSVQRIEGKSFHLATRQRVNFTIWKDAADKSGLPLRFEFRPRSFLKLSFERDPSAATSVAGLREVPPPSQRGA